MCPFIDRNVLNEIAFDIISNRGINEIHPIVPFIDEYYQ